MKPSNRIEAIRSLIRDVPDFPKPGILFKDITPLLQHREGLSLVTDEFCERFCERALPSVDLVVGIESRGFIFGAPLALRLGAGFVPVRKPGKLPYKVNRIAYKLEYGEGHLEVHEDAITPGANVLIVDDLLATGGTAAAAYELVKSQGANVLSFAFVVELAFLEGAKRLTSASVDSLLRFE